MGATGTRRQTAGWLAALRGKLLPHLRCAGGSLLRGPSHSGRPAPNQRLHAHRSGRQGVSPAGTGPGSPACLQSTAPIAGSVSWLEGLPADHRQALHKETRASKVLAPHLWLRAAARSRSRCAASRCRPGFCSSRRAIRSLPAWLSASACTATKGRAEKTTRPATSLAAAKLSAGSAAVHSRRACRACSLRCAACQKGTQAVASRSWEGAAIRSGLRWPEARRSTLDGTASGPALRSPQSQRQQKPQPRTCLPLSTDHRWVPCRAANRRRAPLCSSATVQACALRP